MHIIDVFGGERLPVSFEIFPPKGDLPVEEAREVIGGLAPLSPSFVSVTYSAGGSGNSSRTIDVAKMAQDEYGLNMMAHLTCMNADRAGIEREGAPASAADLRSVDAPRICLYRDLDPEGSGDVPDPWYGGHQDFLDTLEVIERVTPVIVDLVR